MMWTMSATRYGTGVSALIQPLSVGLARRSGLAAIIEAELAMNCTLAVLIAS
jgi:hypothetical protein